MASAGGAKNRGKWTRRDRNVPDGWFNYRPYGSPIGSTRIIPVKTPLKETFNNGRRKTGEVVTDYHQGVPIEEELTPTQLVRKLESDGLVLGMVVDLTFTKRYYDPNEFEALGVDHMKIMCPGHEIPNDTIYQRLSSVITEFLQNEDNHEKLIAIHCTHGLNRTGYLVCRYIMEHCGYSADEAIHAFNQARGYDIERENYLEHIRKGCPPLSPRSPQGSTGRPGRGGDVTDKRDLRAKIPRISRADSPSLASSRAHPRKVQQEDLRARIQRDRDLRDSSNPSAQRRRGNRRPRRQSPFHQDAAAGTTSHGRQHVEERDGPPHASVPALKRPHQYREATRPDHVGSSAPPALHGTPPPLDTHVTNTALDRNKLSIDASAQKLTENISGASECSDHSTTTAGGAPSDKHFTGSINESGMPYLATDILVPDATHSFACSSVGFWAVTVAIAIAAVGVLLQARHGQ